MNASPSDVRSIGPSNFCGECGVRLETGSQFCRSCGVRARVVTTSPVTAEVSVSPPQQEAWAASSPPRPSGGSASKRGWLPWVVAAILFVVAAGAFFAESRSLSATRAELDSTRVTLTNEQSKSSDLSDQVATLTSENDKLSNENGTLNSTNSDLRAAAKSCQRSADMNKETLQSFLDLFDGIGSAGHVLSLARRADSAAQDCQARFSNLGF